MRSFVKIELLVDVDVRGVFIFFLLFLLVLLFNNFILIFILSLLLFLSSLLSIVFFLHENLWLFLWRSCEFVVHFGELLVDVDLAEHPDEIREDCFRCVFVWGLLLFLLGGLWNLLSDLDHPESLLLLLFFLLFFLCCCLGFGEDTPEYVHAILQPYHILAGNHRLEQWWWLLIYHSLYLRLHLPLLL